MFQSPKSDNYLDTSCVMYGTSDFCEDNNCWTAEAVIITATATTATKTAFSSSANKTETCYHFISPTSKSASKTTAGKGDSRFETTEGQE